MTKTEAYLFLRANQPLPDDPFLTDEQARRFDEARRVFMASPEPEAVPLFLNAFGDGSGFGTYQLVEDLMRMFDRAEVVKHMISALASAHRGVRYWNAQMASVFPCDELVEPLALLLADAGDFDVRYAAVTALEQIRTDQAKAVLRQALTSERDREIADLIVEALSD